MTNIKIIQGDYKSIKVEFTAPQYTLASFKFSSEALGLAKDYAITDNVGYIVLTSAETADLTPLVGSFDITVTTADNKVITGVYNGIITVLEKVNK